MRRCPACTEMSVPMRSFFWSHRWKPALCGNCSAAVVLDRSACVRAAVVPLALTVVLLLSLYLSLRIAVVSDRVVLVVAVLYVAAWVNFTVQVLFRIPLRVKEP